MSEYSFARALRVERAKLGISQTELARRAGLHPVQISKMERGITKDVTATTVRALCQALGISSDTLLRLGNRDEENDLVAAAVA